jgi:hypothetical protein
MISVEYVVAVAVGLNDDDVGMVDMVGVVVLEVVNVVDITLRG